LARAKRTGRAEARRRYRVAQAEAPIEEESGESTGAASKSEAAKPQRTGFFAGVQESLHWPNYRADLRAFPSIIRSRPAVAIPFLIVLAGFAAGATLPAAPPSSATDATYSASGSIGYYVFLFGLAQPFLVYLLAGFLVPRGSYILGAILGVFSVVLIQILAAGRIGVFAQQAQEDAGSLLVATVLGGVVQAFYGGFFAGFFRWYTDFLRRSSAKSRQARADRDKDKRRQDRTAGRRPDPKSATTRPAR